MNKVPIIIKEIISEDIITGEVTYGPNIDFTFSYCSNNTITEEDRRWWSDEDVEAGYNLLQLRPSDNTLKRFQAFSVDDNILGFEIDFMPNNNLCIRDKEIGAHQFTYYNPGNIDGLYLMISGEYFNPTADFNIDTLLNYVKSKWEAVKKYNMDHTRFGIFCPVKHQGNEYSVDVYGGVRNLYRNLSQFSSWHHMLTSKQGIEKFLYTPSYITVIDPISEKEKPVYLSMSIKNDLNESQSEEYFAIPEWANEDIVNEFHTMDPAWVSWEYQLGTDLSNIIPELNGSVISIKDGGKISFISERNTARNRDWYYINFNLRGESEGEEIVEYSQKSEIYLRFSGGYEYNEYRWLGTFDLCINTGGIVLPDVMGYSLWASPNYLPSSTSLDESINEYSGEDALYWKSMPGSVIRVGAVLYQNWRANNEEYFPDYDVLEPYHQFLTTSFVGDNLILGTNYSSQLDWVRVDNDWYLFKSNANINLDNSDKWKELFGISAKVQPGDYNKGPGTLGGGSRRGGGKGGFDDSTTPIGFTPLPRSAINIGDFFKTYVFNDGSLTILGEYIHNDNQSEIVDQLLNYIISFKTIYLPSGTFPNFNNEDFKIGGRKVPAGSSGGQDIPLVAGAVTSQYVQRTILSFDFNEYYGTFLDYGNYTKVKIWLPFYGYLDLDTNLCMGGHIDVQATIDILSGTCVYEVKSKKSIEGINFEHLIYSVTCNVSQELSITASSYRGRTSQLLALGSSIASIGFGAITGNPLAIAGGAAGTVTAGSALAFNAGNAIRSGNVNMESGAMSCRFPYIQVTRPRRVESLTFDEMKGLTCNMQVDRLSDCPGGYCEVSYIHLEDINATSEEIDEIDRLLKEGIILPE